MELICSALLFVTTATVNYAGSPPLLFSNRTDIILFISPEENNSIIVKNLKGAIALDFLYSDGMIFWTDVFLHTINRVIVNQTAKEKEVISTGPASEGLACDWVGRKLYWLDSTTKRMEVVELDGSNRKVLYWHKLDKPRALALDPFNGYVYWTDWGSTPKIEKAGMDGDFTTRKVLVDSNIEYPNGMTLDYDNSRIYWVDAKFKYIHSVDLDGNDRRVIIDNNEKCLPFPFALTLYDDKLYYTDWRSDSIRQCNKLTGSDVRDVLTDIYLPMDIHAYSAQRQKMRKNPCGTSNGGCSHLCLLSPTTPFYKCACATPIQLLADNKTCAESPQQFLVFARWTELRIIDLDTPDYEQVQLPVPDLNHFNAIDYDPVDGHVYWTDGELKVIKRAYLNGTGQMIIIDKKINNPDGIAVDWVARNLYWTDTGRDRIEVARLNGTYRRVLISEDLDEPRTICLDPFAGHMYWSDWGRNPKISRADLDGGSHVVLINSSLGWPNGLALDLEDRKLFWGDAKTDQIEMANLNGTERKVLVSGVPHVFGFTLLGDYIYWSDWQTRSIERALKTTGKNRTVIVDEIPDLMGLQAVNIHKRNACGKNNGGCSDLCLMIPVQPFYKCTCPKGWLLLADGKTCAKGPNKLLLLARRKDLMKISLDTANYTSTKLQLDDVLHAVAVDYDPVNKHVYWTDDTLNIIQKANLDGSGQTVVIKTGSDHPNGLAVDWLNRNLYWTDAGTDSIHVARLNGTYHRVLISENLGEPRAICLDPVARKMYWADIGELSVSRPRIERADLDGGGRIALVNTRLGWPSALAIDFKGRRIFWCDAHYNKIEVANLDGTHRRVILDMRDEGLHITGFTLLGDYLYWADWWTHRIEAVMKTTGGNRTIIADQLPGLNGLKAVSIDYSEVDTVGCQQNNFGCSHLCLNRPQPKGPVCACPVEMHLDSTGKKCILYEGLVMFTSGNSIKRMQLDRNSHITTVYSKDGPWRNIVAIDFDFNDHRIYWSDKISIRRAYKNGTSIETILSGLENTIQLAVDWIGHNIFWMKYLTYSGQIEVARLDGSFKKVLIWENLLRPGAIAVNPICGHIYWTDNSNNPILERANMDGSSRKVLVSNLGHVTSLTIDYVQQHLYWANIAEGAIETSDLDGRFRRYVLSGLPHPMALAQYKQFLYWYDLRKRTVHRADKTTGFNRLVIQRKLDKRINDILIFQPQSRHLDRHPCTLESGGCSQLCLPMPNNTHVCACASPYTLRSDNKTCKEEPFNST